MACPCILTAEFMTRLGAVHAAKMHLDKNAQWTAEDWRKHIDEEDRYLRPLLAEHFPLFLAVYDADHRVFLFELKQFGQIVSSERLAVHSAMEDYVSRTLMDMGY